LLVSLAVLALAPHVVTNLGRGDSAGGEARQLQLGGPERAPRAPPPPEGGAAFGAAAAAAGTSGVRTATTTTATIPSAPPRPARPQRPPLLLGRPAHSTWGVQPVAARAHALARPPLSDLARVPPHVHVPDRVRAVALHVLTGRRPDTLADVELLVPIRARAPLVVSLPQVFREAGYRTVSIGKVFHWINETSQALGGPDDREISWDEAVLPAMGDGGGECPGKLTWCSCGVTPSEPDCPDQLIASAAVATLARLAANKDGLLHGRGLPPPPHGLHLPVVVPRALRQRHGSAPGREDAARL